MDRDTDLSIAQVSKPILSPIGGLPHWLQKLPLVLYWFQVLWDNDIINWSVISDNDNYKLITLSCQPRWLWEKQSLPFALNSPAARKSSKFNFFLSLKRLLGQTSSKLHKSRCIKISKSFLPAQAGRSSPRNSAPVQKGGVNKKVLLLLSFMFFNCIKRITIISNGGRWVGSRLTGEHKPGQTAFSAALLSLALWPWSAALRNTNYANLKKMKLLLCCCCCRRCYQICLWTRNWRLDSTWLSFVVPNTFFL